MLKKADIIRVSTEDFPERDRVARYREEFGRSFFGIDIEPLPHVQYRSNVTIRSLAGVSMSLIGGGGMRASRTRELLADGRDGLVLVASMRGRTGVWQRAREFALDERAATILSLGEMGGIIRPQTDQRVLMLNMPRAAIGPLVPDADDAVMRSLPPDSAALRLLVKYAGGLLEGSVGALQPELQRSIACHVCDLFVAALGGSGDAIEVAKGRGIPAARLKAIKSDILENLLSRDLSVEAICARHDITPRYLRMLFAREQTTFSDFVTGQRIALALRRLRDPARVGQTISAIAYECGFSDLSYFNRVFRRAFGMTPSDTRVASSCLGAPR
jgi:AraC-like DNA-binding protein